jgi:hypothetical protein
MSCSYRELIAHCVSINRRSGRVFMSQYLSIDAVHLDVSRSAVDLRIDLVSQYVSRSCISLIVNRRTDLSVMQSIDAVIENISL